MRGVYFDGERLGLRTDLPRPEPRGGEVVARVRRAGICETDLQIARGYMGFSGILGHEFVAEIAGGRRVVADINHACGECETCRAGMSGHCPRRTVLGILGRDGAMADFVRLGELNLHEVPDAVDDVAAVFIEPLAAAFRVPEQVEMGPSTRVAVLGDGKLGILCAWVARLTGAEVTLVGKHASKLALAGEGVATLTLAEVDGLARRCDVVIEATGSTSGLPTALGLVRPRGAVVLKTTVAGEHATTLAPVVIDEIRVIGSRCGPFPKAIDALARGLIDVTPLVGATYSLDDAEAAFAAAGTKGALKVILEINSR